MSGSGNEHALFETILQEEVGLHEASLSQFSVDGLMGVGGCGPGAGLGDGVGVGEGPGCANQE